MDTGLPVALDETIDEMGPDCVQQLSKYRVDGVVAMVCSSLICPVLHLGTI